MKLVKVRFYEKEIIKFLILCHRHTDQTFHCIRRVCLNFRAQKCSNYKVVKQKEAEKAAKKAEKQQKVQQAMKRERVRTKCDTPRPNRMNVDKKMNTRM